MSAAPRNRWVAVCSIALVALLALTAIGFAKRQMQSTKLGPRLCETTGGGKFVDIRQFPGEKLDRRLLNDVKYLQKRYKIFVTDGYSMDAVHSANGEHPLGLALDIVPDKSVGGTWNDIDRLAAWAEPRQDRPRTPFRWVGYDGDENHGRGHHLHLSWSHTETKAGRPAKTVFTIRCPGSAGVVTPPPEPEPEPPDGGGVGAGGNVGIGGNGGGGVIGGGGGLVPKLSLAPVVAESGGRDAGE